MPSLVAGAASESLREPLLAPPGPAELLAVFPTAIYLRTTAPPHQVVPIVRSDALRLPGSVVVSHSGDLGEWMRGSDSLGAGTVVVGGGQVRLPDSSIAINRWWRSTSAFLPWTGGLFDRVQDLAANLPPLPAEVAAQAVRLATALLAQDEVMTARAARSLVGRGPGLTPAGDDVLAGLLLTLSGGPPEREELGARLAAAVLSDAEARTTALSDFLLRCAARGEGLPQVVELISGLATEASSADADAQILAGVLSVGSSSGVALAHGVLLGARTIAAGCMGAGDTWCASAWR